MGELIEASSINIDFNKGVCSVCRKKPVARWCDYIIDYNHSIMFVRKYEDFAEINRRGAQYITCDLPMCEDCAHNVSLDHDLCPHHKMLQDMVRLPNDYQRQRQQWEKTKIAMEYKEQSQSEKVRKQAVTNPDQMTLFD